MNGEPLKEARGDGHCCTVTVSVFLRPLTLESSSRGGMQYVSFIIIHNSIWTESMIPNADDDDNMDTSLNKSLLYVQQPICG